MALGGGPRLGQLEAGVAAQLFVPMVSVVSGGLGARSETSPPPSRISP